MILLVFVRNGLGPVIKRPAPAVFFTIAGLAMIVAGLFLWRGQKGPSGEGTGEKGIPASAESKVFRSVATSSKVIALTFDDGPDPRFTPKVLEVLRKHRARATFFVVGRAAEEYPEILEQVAREGHVIGNHGYSHTKLTGLTREQIRAEIRRTERLISAATGARPVYFRPPFGFYNREVLEAADELGYRVILWTREADTRDYTRPGAGAIVRQAVRNASAGYIFLFHDGGGDRTQTVAALDEILGSLAAKGYRFMTLDQILREGAGFGE